MSSEIEILKIEVDKMDEKIAELSEQLKSLKEAKKGMIKRIQDLENPKPQRKAADPEQVIQRYRENAKKYYSEHREEILAKRRAKKENVEVVTLNQFATVDA